MTKQRKTSTTVAELEKPRKAVANQRQTEKVLLVGLDLGTNTTCLEFADSENPETELSELIPSLVGYARNGILPDVIPGNETTLFGTDALKYKLHLDLVQPLRDGIIDDMDAVRDYLEHLKSKTDTNENTEIRAVIGIPANTGPVDRENVRVSVTGLFDKVILIPEPFLAALGCREVSKSSESGYIDPISNSIFVDIGAGSSDICLIQGYYPSSEDQISFAFAGDAIDEMIQQAILAKYPDSGISIAKCREIKEQHSFVNGAKTSVLAPVMINGKVKELEVADAINAACNALLERIYQAVRSLIVRADSDSIPSLLQNIIMTGGGSMISGIDKALEDLLTEEGFEGCKVSSIGESFKTRVATGALVAARQAGDHQWQTLLR